MTIHTVTQVPTSTRTQTHVHHERGAMHGRTQSSHARPATQTRRWLALRLGSSHQPADDQCERRPQESTRAARESSPGLPLVFRRGPTTRRHSELSDDAPPRRRDRDAERRVVFFPFFVGHSDGISDRPACGCCKRVAQGLSTIGEVPRDRGVAPLAGSRRRGGYLATVCC
ncbi:hypothetical protein C2845_PM18G02290 [Panicum miliaceum]|uniref:Uncharacterized protein n=1 Tax=Panicum miliaceum TaxID=4540 RepID=A0A3L6PGW0_PANMI|nr:hypothetical protein C2845_PM18G02290 [Panicum miliaceum]